MFISSYLLVYETVLAGPLKRAEVFYPAWPSLAVDVVQSLFFTTPTIALFVLFPDGGFVPALSTMADPLLDPVERSDDLPATLLLVSSCRHNRDRRRVCVDLSLPVRLHTHRATTNQLGTPWPPLVAAADEDTQRVLQSRVEPSIW
jgi:hypothetical protein